MGVFHTSASSYITKSYNDRLQPADYNIIIYIIIESF